jgi:carbon-monoxide dehydrogenase small subunit
MERPIKLTVNGEEYNIFVEPKKTLIEVIRGNMGLTGTKEGCGRGDCGACTVLLNGKAVNSCLVLAVDANGQRVTTIEGLAQESALHPIQKAFVEQGAIQCGFCTPGMIMSAKALLEKRANPTESEIRAGIEGNLCRCTGYLKIVDAIKVSAEDMSKKQIA